MQLTNEKVLASNNTMQQNIDRVLASNNMMQQTIENMKKEIDRLKDKNETKDSLKHKAA